MNNAGGVFLDANVLVYFLDETAALHSTTIAILQKLVDDQAELYTSHHVIEEVLFIVHKLAKTSGSLAIAINKITELPTLKLIEPAADMAFAARYSELVERVGLGVNDALLIQLMLDVGLSSICSFDKALLKRAKKLHILAAAPENHMKP